MSNKPILNLDRQWFKKNPSRNFRIRRGGPGEIEELMRRSVVAGRLAPGHELEAAQRVIGEIDAGKEWRVLIIDAAPGLMLRMLVARDANAGDEMDEAGHGGVAVAFVIGNKIPIDRVAG